MPLVDQLNPSDLDRIHLRRMAHAHFALFLDLLSLDIPAVDEVLAKRSINLLPYRRVGIDYADGDKQILVKELLLEKARLAKAAKAPAKGGKKKK